MIRERLAAPALVLAASLAVLGGAFLFQYVGGLAPCELCLAQRYPYGVTIALSILALLFARGAGRGRGRAALLLLCALAFAIGAGIAVFHVGVEHHWWEGTAACTGNGSAAAAGSLEALRAQIMSQPIVRCDKIAWSLFGLSLAGYNVLISIALAAFSLWAGRRAWAERQP